MTEVLDVLPKGWKVLKGATTAPKGYVWASNGKSRFSKDYKNALVKEDALVKEER